MSEELKDALARIACLEGEIAKRDEELAACRVAVENCEVFRARIAEMQERFDSSAHRTSLIGRLEIENAQLSAELAAIKAQEPVAWETPSGGIYRDKKVAEIGFRGESVCKVTPLYAAPVSEANAQGVVMQATDGGRNPRYEGLFDGETEEHRAFRLNATHVQQVSVADGSTKMQWPEIVALVNEVLGCEAHKYPCERGSIGHEMTGINFNSLARIIDRVRYAAAPAAPAADAGLVEALGGAVDYLNDNKLNSIHYGSILYEQMRAALAAHRAKWVA